MGNYELRGNRVSPMAEGEINELAISLAKIFKLNKRNRKRCDKAFEQLSEIGVTLDVIDDREWLGLTKGHFDHTSMTISVPQSVYNDACVGSKDALFIMLHELGHLFLMHRPLLHSSNEPVSIEEDAEWQADTFAHAILCFMGYDRVQMTFDFYM